MDLKRFISQVALSAALATSAATTGAFEHPVDVPAMPSRLAARSPLLAIANAGERLVAVGLRGQIVYSDDQGKSWSQAKVPVSTDMVALAFPSALQGWAVGHGGVVLHSTDGGATWTKKLDGAQAAKIAIGYFESRAASDPIAAHLLADEKGLLDAGGTQPFLGVHFENDKVGYVVGTFNRIFRTEDGGETWQPLMDWTDNPKGLHFNAVVGGHGLYLAGELGLVWRLDPARKRFVQVPTPYNGTLFGLVADGPVLLAFGMRGSLYRSEDEGKTWVRIALGTVAGITGGSVLPDGAIALVTQAGGIYVSHDGARNFSPHKPSLPMSYFGVNPAGKNRIVLSGSEGVRVESLQ